MRLRIGNAPCSWGIESPDDPGNPPWTRVLDETAAAGYAGLELGPIGFMPEEPSVLFPALAERGLTRTAGVMFQPFHDGSKWDQVLDGARRTGQALASLGASEVVLTDSISPRREQTAGRSADAKRLTGDERDAFLQRIRTVAEMAVEEFGLTASFHAHAGGYVEFEDELEYLLDTVEPRLLGVCLDTGHCVYAGFNPVDFYRRHANRVSYLHLKDVDPAVRAHVLEHRVEFWDAWALGLFCNLGKGEVDFPGLRAALVENEFSGWATVEQDCEPKDPRAPLDDARSNLAFLASAGLA